VTATELFLLLIEAAAETPLDSPSDALGMQEIDLSDLARGAGRCSCLNLRAVTLPGVRLIIYVMVRIYPNDP
jgi:hypothetical protein